jgi:hypothetical protein
LDALGLTPDDYGGPAFEMWPETEQVIRLYSSISTQWRMGFSGPIGLDYSVLFARMDRMRLSADEYEYLFQDIRVVESEALAAMNKRED